MEAVAKQAGTSNYKAYTIAQFLSQTNRYDGTTQRNVLTGEPGDKVARTVIVDECSMLTEEMMAALPGRNERFSWTEPAGIGSIGN